jgi:hypothetical protein
MYQTNMFTPFVDSLKVFIDLASICQPQKNDASSTPNTGNADLRTLPELCADALHRLPESVAHIAEALWMQALEEGRRRATLVRRDTNRLAVLDTNNA